MAADDRPSGFEINGEVYEVPYLDSFDMDEAQILYDLSGVTLEDFKPPHPDAPELEQAAILQLQLIRTRTPAFRRALVHIAYRRKHEEYDFDAMDKAFGKMNAADVSIAISTVGSGDDEVDPSKSSPKPLDVESNESVTSEQSNGGSHSGSVSEGRVLSLAPTGTSASDTSSPASDPAIPVSAS